MKRFLAMVAMGLAGALPGAADVVRDPDLHPVDVPALDVTQAELLKTEDGRLVVRVGTADPCAVERLRFMLDVDGAANGEPESGADFMLEGSRFYRYPEGAKGWTWDEIGSAAVISEGRTITFVLPELKGLSGGGWFVETTRPDWSVADRLPDEKTVPFDLARLPVTLLKPKLQPEDVSELIRNLPRSLSFRLDAELKARKWRDVPAAEMKSPSWQPPFMTSAIPVVVRLTDAATRESAVVVPQASAVYSNAVQWTGRAIGVDWLVMLEPLESGDVQVTGFVASETDRCVRVEIGCGLDLAGWTWQDDVRRRRAIGGDSVLENTVESPYGMDGRVSLYPFGLISSGAGSVIVETDPDEPRIFRIAADPKGPFFGVAYDLGITRSTSNFPGRATFRCALRAGPGGDSAFRQALASFGRRNPDFVERRAPQTGAWLPFRHPAGISNAVDFGFGFFEKDDGSEESQGPSVRGMLTMGYTEPWLYWLPMSSGIERSVPEALRLMTIYGAGNDVSAEHAVSALLGAARNEDGSIAMEFMDVPWNSGARMEVNTDPELQPTKDLPLNRAMSEWRRVRRMIGEEGLDGVYLDSMAELSGVDCNPAAMAVADYPCSFTSHALRPAVAMPMAAYEYVAALAGALRPRGKLLMGNFACVQSPFFMKFIDVAGEEIEWEVPGRFEPLDGRKMDVRRAMCGRKPYALLLNTSFNQLSGDSVRRYFEDCMFWAVLPGFFARDGAQNYWDNPRGYDRDRALFKTYLPVIRRLADAGWSPREFVRSASDAVETESYGGEASRILHLTLRNSGDAPVQSLLRFSAPAERCVVIDPISGDSGLVDSNTTTCPVALPPESVRVRDVVPLSSLGEELAFAGDWKSGYGESDALAKTMQSFRDEARLGAACAVTIPVPAVRGQTNAFSLTVVNDGEGLLKVSDLKVISTKQFRPFEAEATSVRPKDDVQWPGYFVENDVADNPWLEVQWTIARGADTQVCSRMVRPEWVSPLRFVTPATNIVAGGEAAYLEIDVRNFSAMSRTIRFRWDGDFKRGKQEEVVPPESARRIRLPVPGGRVKEGQVFVEASSDGETAYQQWFDVRFAGP